MEKSDMEKTFDNWIYALTEICESIINGYVQ